MSNHKTPLTDLEREGMIAHGLESAIGKPSQLADTFRAGIAWALNQQPKKDSLMFDFDKLRAVARTCGARLASPEGDLTFAPASLRDLLRAYGLVPLWQKPVLLRTALAKKQMGAQLRLRS